MRKEEFLEQLEMLLADISAEERAEAMAFYRSYFEDAGMGNEEKILAELESPEKVAEIIKRDLGMVCTTEVNADDVNSENFTESAQGTTYRNSTQGGVFQNDTENVHGTAYQSNTQSTQNTYGTYADSEEAKRENERKNTIILVLVIVLGVLTSPAWLGILTGLIGTIFGLSVALIAITFAMFVVGIAFVGAGLTMLVSVSALAGIAFIGAGLFVLALAVLLLLADIEIFGRFLPWVCKGIYRLCKKPFEKKKEA